MHQALRVVIGGLLLPLATSPGSLAAQGQGGAAAGRLDLPTLLERGAIQAVNRDVEALVDGGRRGARLSAAMGDGVGWINGVEFATGTIELEIRGKDVPQQSFVGVAFAGSDDRTYEAIYLRPFNFRVDGPGRSRAVQYVSHPDFPWQRLRTEQPGIFESPVEPAPDATTWVPVRIVVERARVLTYVGEGTEPDLVVERLGNRTGTRVGLWVGNNSDGDFANLRIVPDE